MIRKHRSAMPHSYRACRSWAGRSVATYRSTFAGAKAAMPAFYANTRSNWSRLRLGRCYLKGRAGDAANVILSAVGYNLRLVLAWLRMILRVVLLALFQTFAIRLALKPAF